jgi:hypothetical protein
MHPRDCSYYCENGNKKQYQIVIMYEDGMTYRVGRLYDWNEVQKAAKEIRELYAKHGITHRVGFLEV